MIFHYYWGGVNFKDFDRHPKYCWSDVQFNSITRRKRKLSDHALVTAECRSGESCAFCWVNYLVMNGGSSERSYSFPQIGRKWGAVGSYELSFPNTWLRPLLPPFPSIFLGDSNLKDVFLA